MAEEVLKRIQEAEKQADLIIFNAGEEAKSILRMAEIKIREESEDTMSHAYLESEKLKEMTVADTDNAVKVLLEEEEENIQGILNIHEDRINEVVNLLAERIVK